ncbi:MAG: TetR family transcriptional regulator [Rhodopseudomonas sp.]|nr:TetR family transcriptional regulator [Rhodopseudomonas sp.]
MPKSSVLSGPPLRERSETGTDARILESAITLFAQRGFSEVTVRDIAEHAAANPASISYYFGAKESLIKQAIRTVVAPLNEQRLAALDALEASGAPLRHEDVVRAMVEPTVRACLGGVGPERHYARVLVLTFALRQPFVDEVMSEQTDRVAARFVDALVAALPDFDRATMYWRFDFMVGALIHILLDPSRGYRLRRVSEGGADTSDPAAVIDALVRFLSAGMLAPPGP